MRKLMWFTIGFVISCFLCVYVLQVQSLRLCLIVSGVCALLPAVIGRKFPLYRRAALVFFGCFLGFFWFLSFQKQYLAPTAVLDGQTEVATIRTTDYSEESDYGTSVAGSITLGDKRYRVRVYLEEKEILNPGMLLTGPFRFSVTAPAEEPVSYLSGDGIFLTASQTDEIMVYPDSGNHWLDEIARLRHWLIETLKSCFQSDSCSFAMALLLGDTSEIDYATDTDLKVSGIRHVIAVSGLHVSILVALLAMGTFRKKYLMVPAGLGVLVLFAALAGFSPSVTRACLMSGLLLLATLFKRDYDGATALSFSVLVMLVSNPLVISSVSFQLSVASVSGIFLFDPRIRQWLLKQLEEPLAGKRKQRLIRWFCTSISISLSAMILTTPLCGYYFGMVSLVGVLTNLLCLWVVSGIFYGIMAVCLLYALWEGGAVLLANLVALPIRYVLAVAGCMADLPLAAVYTDSVYIVAWVVFVYVLLTVFFFSTRRRPKVLLCCGILGLCVALIASWTETDDTVITILDVGQGQCIVLQSEGKTYMVDCGGDVDERTADIAANFLLSRGIDRLDGLILTHMDRDHAAGAAHLLTRIDTELLILPEVHAQMPAGETVYACEDLRLEAGKLRLTVYAPTFPGTSNEKSLCVLFDTEKCDILITGDRDGFGERMLLRNGIPEVDVLIAGHHGSKYSTCEELLAAVSPEIVCISAGKDNPFGHPAKELLQRLNAFGCTVYRTDKHGTITIRR